MIRLRFLMLWLLMAAVPLQGLAAASMLYCGMGAQHGAAHSMAVAATSVPDPTSHDHDHERDHGAMAKAEKSAAGQQQQQQLPGANHECSVCAACSNAVAITTVASSVGAMPLPQAELAEPFVLIQRRPAPVPDKPPRG